MQTINITQVTPGKNHYTTSDKGVTAWTKYIGITPDGTRLNVETFFEHGANPGTFYVEDMDARAKAVAKEKAKGLPRCYYCGVPYAGRSCPEC